MIKNLGRLQSKLHKLELNVETLMEDLEPVAKDILHDAKDIAPVRSGKLKDSLDYEINKNEIVIYSDCDYAKYVEFGTSKMKAQPFLQPAFDMNKRYIEDIIKSEILMDL